MFYSEILTNSQQQIGLRLSSALSSSVTVCLIWISSWSKTDPEI